MDGSSLFVFSALEALSHASYSLRQGNGDRAHDICVLIEDNHPELANCIGDGMILALEVAALEFAPKG
jgi:hypothetical protein